MPRRASGSRGTRSATAVRPPLRRRPIAVAAGRGRVTELQRRVGVRPAVAQLRSLARDVPFLPTFRAAQRPTRPSAVAGAGSTSSNRARRLAGPQTEIGLALRPARRQSRCDQAGGEGCEGRPGFHPGQAGLRGGGERQVVRGVGPPDAKPVRCVEEGRVTVCRAEQHHHDVARLGGQAVGSTRLGDDAGTAAARRSARVR